MGADDAPKSALEIAMERLRQKDAEQGVVQKSLTAEQKAEIAEVRNVYEARIAQLEVMHKSSLARTFDPAEREELEKGYRTERERLAGDRDRKIEDIRNR